MKAAIFDVDGTMLAGRLSSEALFVRYLFRSGMIGPRQAAQAGLFALVNAPRYGQHVFRKNKAYLAGLALDDVAATARDFVKGELDPLIDRDLLDRMEEHRQAGEAILLLTGTPDFIAGPLAERVGADGWQGARYALLENRFVASPPIRHPLGREKVTAARDLCLRHGADLSGATAYADSIHDLPLLAQVARPVAVRPDRRLADAARSRGWEIMGDPGDRSGTRTARNASPAART